MHPLLHAVSRNDAMTRDDAWATYRRLLAGDKAGPAEVERMKAAMAVLGKTPTDLAADVQKLGEVRRLLDRIAAGTGLEAERMAAAKATAAFDEETRRLADERKRRRAELAAAEYELGQRYQEAYAAVNALQDLKTRHGQVLADVPAVSQADLEPPASPAKAA